MYLIYLQLKVWYAGQGFIFNSSGGSGDGAFGWSYDASEDICCLFWEVSPSLDSAIIQIDGRRGNKYSLQMLDTLKH